MHVDNRRPLTKQGHLHDGVILLLRPEFIAILYYYENYGYFCFMLAGIT